jgi:hypothetical protein
MSQPIDQLARALIVLLGKSKGIAEWQAEMAAGISDADLKAIVADQRVSPLTAGDRPEKVRVEGAVKLDRPKLGNGKGWSEGQPLPDRPPHDRYVNQLLDAEDARWREERRKGGPA